MNEQAIRNRIAHWAFQNGFGCRIEQDQFTLTHRQGISVAYVAMPMSDVVRAVEHLEEWLYHHGRRLLSQHRQRISWQDRRVLRERLRHSLGPNPMAMAPACDTLELLDALEEIIEPSRANKMVMLAMTEPFAVFMRPAASVADGASESITIQGNGEPNHAEH